MANDFQFYADPKTEETQRSFALCLTNFFTVLNGRSKNEYIKRRKPNLKPYYIADDEMLKVKG